ncbi:phage tail sheath family protein [Streptacidiphilus rugosus]|uniref:phage tail sheath family protein n=1 Tax=Streptacidiphilus rugosus TaxID=405783 RepID=UPI00055B6752|nr:phage tail sheath family protein [Streptacidiphilus rugosus]
MPSYLSPGVYMEEVSSGSRPIEGVGTAVAAFVGFTEKGPFNEPQLVTNWTQFTQTFGGFVEGTYLAQAVYGYFQNGGGVAYVVRVGSAAEPEAKPARAQLPSGTSPTRPAFAVRALTAGPATAGLAVEVADATEPGEDNFKLIVTQDGQVKETFDNVSVRKGPHSVMTAVRGASKLITIEEVKGAPLVAPAKGKVDLAGAPAPAPAAVPQVSPDAYVGNSSDRTGFAGLEAIDEVTMLCVPDLMAAYQNGGIDLEGLKAVQLGMIAHCELMADRVAVLDAPPGMNAQQVKTWRQETAGYDSKYAALYWPWVKVMDPQSGKAVHVPPSGHMAGIWARNDASRGVHKAPANEIVRGAISVELNITKGEHDQLNPLGINCIRAFPGQGIRVWGARTLSSDPEWRYLNVRRLFNFVEESILQGTNWVVFEPNDPKLWDSVKRTITMFLRTQWRAGALFGRSPDQAFFVKCDEENNPGSSRDQGILNVEIGIAPVKPAEFVVFRISQFADGSGLEE